MEEIMAVKKMKYEQWCAIVFWGFLFFSLIAFFTKAHMLVPYDGDDWNNLSAFRAAYPKVGAWNPIKILPEDSFPIMGYVGAYFIMPFVKDYVFSIALASAIFLSLAICVYVFLFSQVLERNFKLPSYAVYALSLGFFLLHFLALYASDVGSQYLFGSANLTCFYHYTIPGLLNLCLVEYFLAYGIPKQMPWERGIGHCGALFFALYLAIFSNVLHNIILIAFIAAHILFTYRLELFSPKNWKSIWKENHFLAMIMVVWVLSLAFELTGGRANSIGASVIHLPLKQTILSMWGALKTTNKMFLVFLVLTLAAFWRAKAWRGELIHVPGKLLVSGLFTGLYLFMVCAKASAGYITRADVLLGIYAFLIMGIVTTAAIVLEKRPKLFMLAPILLLIISMDVLRGPYVESTMGRLLPRTCYLVDNDMIEQIKKADEAHQKEMVLHVPKGDNLDNWPHPMYMGENISRTLYRHGIITRPIEITLQPDVSMNEKYNIPIQK